MKNKIGIASVALVSALVLFAVSVSVAPAMAQPTPSTPYMIQGYVFYNNSTACNGPVVNVTNLNTSEEWQAETNATTNYYQLVLANGTDINASEVLQFKVKDKDPAATQLNITDHTITQAELNNGGVFSFNITLKEAMHVHSIDMSTTKYNDKGWYTYATATVTVVNSTGAPVEGATVEGHWSGLTSDTDSGLTNSTGQVALDSDSVKNAAGTFTFTVDNVAKEGWAYDQEANEETSDSITVP